MIERKYRLLFTFVKETPNHSRGMTMYVVISDFAVVIYIGILFCE